MRSVKKAFDSPANILQSEGCKKKLNRLYRKKISTASVFTTTGTQVRRDLEALYFGKCAYCETKVTGSVLRVDHYCPKDKIKEDNTHTGYYWLGYEWSNLVPACEKCN